MMFSKWHWLRTWMQRFGHARPVKRQPIRRRSYRPRLEALEDRLAPSTTASLLADINTQIPTGFTMGTPLQVGNSLYFTNASVVNDYGLWRSDGTAAGTTLLSSDVNSSGRDGAPFNVGGTIYFGRQTDIYNSQTSSYIFTNYLLKSDGTAAGTSTVATLPGTKGNTGLQGQIFDLNGTALFLYNDGTTGIQLWASNGTAAGTIQLTTGGAGSVAIYKGLAYFGGFDASHGNELWTSDGTVAGTKFFMDINPGSASSNAAPAVVANNFLYFTGNDGTHGNQLWKTDGTSANTSMVTDINPGSSFIIDSGVTNASGELYFSAYGNYPNSVVPTLWRTDGTTANTVQVTDGSNNTIPYPTNITFINNSVYFESYDGTSSFSLWTAAAGSNSTPVLVKTLRTDNNDPLIGGYVNFNGTVYFSANDGVHGTQLWTTNGTRAGTTIALTGYTQSNADVVFNNKLFFQGTNSSGSYTWTLDGTTSATAIFSPLNSASSPSYLTTVGNTVYFAANDGINGNELWKTDGTTGNTTLVTKINPAAAGSSPQNLTAVGSNLFFSADDGTHGRELWESNGTASSTHLVLDINPGSGASSPTYLTASGGKLYFLANDGVHGKQLYVTDGTAGNTIRLTTGGTSAFNLAPFLTDVNGLLFFGANSAGINDGQQLWESNGTVAGTVNVKEINTSGSAYPSSLVNLNGELYFSAQSSNGVNISQLWKSDGTFAGTVKVNAASSPKDVTDIVNANGTLYFSGSDSTHGQELWKSNGTDAGTVLVSDIRPGSGGSYPASLTNVNGKVFFIAADGTHGNGLWVSDGTSGGTMLLAAPSTWTFSAPSNLTALGSTLFFTVYDSVQGWELWSSDGTAAGTVDVENFSTIAPATVPNYLTVLGHHVLLAADNFYQGSELWQTIPGAAAYSVSGLPSTATAGTAGTFTVTAVDSFGSPVPGYTGTIHFTSTDAQAVLPADYTFTTGTGGDNGVHTFTFALKTSGSQTLSMVDKNAGTVIGSATTTVTPAAASALALTGFPSPVIAGVSGSLTVTAKDPYGNTATGYTGTVHFTSIDGQAALPADYTFVGADHGMHTFSGTLKTAGAQSWTATDTVTATITGSQGSITVNPAAASTLVASGFPVSATAGVAGNLTVTAKDLYGNVASGYTGTIHFTSSDVQAVRPADYTFVSADHGIHTFSGTLKTAGAQSWTATDTATASITGTQAAIAVNPAATATFVATGFPAPMTAGVAGNFTVTAEDPYGNNTPTYTGTVHVTSSDGQATLPGDYTFTTGSGADNGVHNFSATLKTAGTETIIVTDKNNASVTGSGSATVIPIGAGSITLGFSSTTTAGVVGSLTVIAKDPYGNTAIGYTGTVHFSSSDSQVGPPANYTFLAGDQGVKIFSASFKTAGIQSLTATDTITASITGSESILVNPAAAATLVVSGFPTPVNAKAPGSFTLTARDPYGNIATGYTGAVHYTSSDAQATLPPDYNHFLPSDNGVHTFFATFRTVGTQSLTATDTAASSITGTQTGITVNPAVAASFSVTGLPTSITAGASTTFTATALDVEGVVVPSYRGTVIFSSSDIQAGLPSQYTFVANDSGVHAFSITFKTAGSPTVTVVDQANIVLGTSSGVTVTPAAASSLVASGLPGSVTAGVATSITVTLKDPYGNVAAGYTGTVHFSSSDGQAVPPADYTFMPGDQGVKNFSVTLKTDSIQSVMATDTTTPSIAGSQSTFVNPAAAAKFVVSGLPTYVTTGVAYNFRVSGRDPYGNGTGYVGTANFSSNDPAASYPASYTSTDTGSGSADIAAQTFTVTFRTTGSVTITATDSNTASITGSQTTTAILPASSFTVTASPATAGAADSVTVTAKDTAGNTVLNYAGTIHFTTRDIQAQAGLPADYTFTAADAGMHTFSITLKTAGNQTVTATDTNTPTVKGMATISVSPAAASALTVSGFPASTAGVAGSFTVTAFDPYGNIATGYTGTVHFTSNGLATSLPADSTLPGGQKTFSATLTLAATVSLTATDATNPFITAGTQSGIVIAPAAAQSLMIGYFPMMTQAGTFNQFRVTAVDPYGNLATGYTGTIVFGSSDPQAIMPDPNGPTDPGHYTFKLSDGGMRGFCASLGTVGTWALTATDINNSSIKGSEGGIQVTPGAAAYFQITGFPNPTTAGTAARFFVAAYDAFNNLATGYTGAIQLSSNPGGVFPPNSYTFTAGDRGAHPFSATFPNTGATNSTYTVTATDTVNKITASVNVNVNLPATHFAVGVSATVTPASIQGITAGTQLVVDSGANQETVYVNSVVGTEVIVTPASMQGITASMQLVVDSGANQETVLVVETVITGGATTANAFGALFMKTHSAGFTITSTDGSVNTVSTTAVATIAPTFTAGFRKLHSAGFAIASTNGTIHTTSTTAVTPVTAGTPFTFFVIPEDQNNNGVFNYQSVLSFSTNDPNPRSVVPGVSSWGSSFQAALLTASTTATITITDGAGISATLPVTVAAAGAFRLAINGVPTSTTVAGTPFNVVITALDFFGNVATGSTGTVHLTTTDPNAAANLPADYTFNGTGQETFTFAFLTAGNQSFTATDSADGLVAGSNTVTIVPAPTHGFSVLVPPSTKAGSAFPFTVTVTAVDLYGNATPAYHGSVSITSDDPLAASPLGTLTFSVGHATQTLQNVVLLSSATRTTITATDTANALTGHTGIQVFPGPAAFATFSNFLPPYTAGQAGQGFIFIRDSSGNVVTDSGTVVLTSDDQAANTHYQFTHQTVTITNGRGIYSLTFYQSGSPTVTAKANLVEPDGGTITFTTTDSKDFNVVAAAPNSLSISGLDDTTMAGFNVPFNATALDLYGNIAVFSGTIGLRVDDTTGSPSQTAVPHQVQSTLTGSAFQFTADLKTAGSMTVTVGGTGGVIGSKTFNLQPGPAASFTVAGVAPFNLPVPAGVPVSVTVTALDQFGNTATPFNGSIGAVAGNSTGVAIDPAQLYSSPFTNGVATIAYAFHKATVGQTDTNPHMLVVSGPNPNDPNHPITGRLTGITVNPGPVGSFTLTPLPQYVTEFASTPFTVKAFDAFGNFAFNYAGTVNFSTSPGSGTVTDNSGNPLTSSGLSQGQGTFNVAFNGLNTQTVTATDSANPAATGPQSTFVILPASALAISGLTPNTVIAGNSITFTVTAEDANGAVVPNYNGTIDFSKTSDARAVFSSNGTVLTTKKYTFNGLTGDNGMHTFTVAFETAGQPTLTVDDVTKPTTIIANQTGITVNAGPFAQYSFTNVSPATGTAGQPFSFTLVAEDQYGNTVPTYQGTVHFQASRAPAGMQAASVPADYPPTGSGPGWVNGAHTFTGSTTFYAATGASQVNGLTATDTSGSSTPSSVFFTVNAAPAAKLGFTSNASSSTPNAVTTGPNNYSFTVTAYDAYGNVATGDNDTLTLSDTGFNANGTALSSAAAAGDVLPESNTASTTAVTNVGLPTTVTPASMQGIVPGVTLVVDSGANQETVTVSSVTATTFTATFLNTHSAGFSITVPNSAQLTNGTGTFTATLNAAGTRTLTVKDGTITVASPTITVNPATTATHFVFFNLPTSVVAWTEYIITFAAVDGGGNVVKTYTGPETITSSNPQAALNFGPGVLVGQNAFGVPIYRYNTGNPLPSAPGEFKLGFAMGTLSSSALPTFTITVTDSAPGSTVTGSFTVTVLPDLQIYNTQGARPGVFTPATVGVPVTFNVKAYNPYDGTLDPHYTGTLSFASSDTGAIFSPNNVTFTNQDPSTTTFSVTFSKVSSPDIYVTDGVASSLVSSSLFQNVNFKVTAGTSDDPTSNAPVLSLQPNTKTVNITVTGKAGAVSSNPILSFDVYTSNDSSGAYNDWTLWSNLTASAVPNASGSYTTAVTPFTAPTDGADYRFYAVARDVKGPSATDLSNPYVSVKYVTPITPPKTSIASVTATFSKLLQADSTPFTVNWTGTAPSGAGLAYVYFYVTIDGGSPKTLYPNTQNPNGYKAGAADSNGVYSGSFNYSSVFLGTHTYEFYSVGVDGNGNQESKTAASAVSGAARTGVVFTFFDPALVPTALEIQNGAHERSYVRYATLSFNQSTGIQDLIDNNAITVTKYDFNGQNGVPLVLLPGTLCFDPNSPLLGNSLLFDFSQAELSGSSTPFGTAGLPDGYYEIAINNADGSVTKLHFYRMQGDVNGDGAVDRTDLNLIIQALNNNGTGLEDINGTGKVTVADKLLVQRIIAAGRKQLLSSLPLDG